MALRIALQSTTGALALQAAPRPGDGVIVAGEVGAPARRARLELLPADAVAEVSLRQSGGVIPIEVRVQAGEFVVESVPAGRLRGGFDLRLQVDDLVVAGRRWKRVPFAGSTETRVSLPVEPRLLRLTKPLAQFDAALRAALDAARLEGLTAAEWLPREPGAPVPAAPRAARPQARRQACLLNLLAVMRASALGERHALDAPLQILRVAADHVSARAGAELFQLVEAESLLKGASPRRRVFHDFGIHASHRNALIELAREVGDAPPVTFESFRFEGRPSLQIVFGIPQGVASSHLIDVDLDLGNPRQDLLGLIVHFGELFDDGLDHVALRDKLAKGPAAPFLSYERA